LEATVDEERTFNLYGIDASVVQLGHTDKPATGVRGRGPGSIGS
jgi:hypothetical protein